MSLALQPGERPGDRRLFAWLTLLALVAAILLLGWWQGARRTPPRVVFAGNAGREAYVAEVLRLVRSATRRVWVAVYVLRPDDGPVAALCEELATARRRGLDVVVCLDQSRLYEGEGIDPKHEAAVAALAQLEVPYLVDDLERRLHAKVVLIDDDYAVVGSHNWTRAALEDNHEVSLILRDREVVAEIELLFRSLPGWADRAGARR